jgi:hypothetical protein
MDELRESPSFGGTSSASPSGAFPGGLVELRPPNPAQQNRRVVRSDLVRLVAIRRDELCESPSFGGTSSASHHHSEGRALRVHREPFQAASWNSALRTPRNRTEESYAPTWSDSLPFGGTSSASPSRAFPGGLLELGPPNPAQQYRRAVRSDLVRLVAIRRDELRESIASLSRWPRGTRPSEPAPQN